MSRMSPEAKDNQERTARNARAAQDRDDSNCACDAALNRYASTKAEHAFSRCARGSRRKTASGKSLFRTIGHRDKRIRRLMIDVLHEGKNDDETGSAVSIRRSPADSGESWKSGWNRAKTLSTDLLRNEDLDKGYGGDGSRFSV